MLSLCEIFEGECLRKKLKNEMKVLWTRSNFF